VVGVAGVGRLGDLPEIVRVGQGPRIQDHIGGDRSLVLGKVLADFLQLRVERHVPPLRSAFPVAIGLSGSGG
jgi:hypothetical protein